MNNQVFVSSSEGDTEQWAAELARQLPQGSVLALQGNLGAGKTVFSRGFARGLGITEPVSSPTYTIIQEYLCPNGNYFYHLDLYRIANANSALAFGVDEYLNDTSAMAIVEWPERIETIMPPDTIWITIEQLSDEERKITLQQTK